MYSAGTVTADLNVFLTVHHDLTIY